MSRVDRTAVDGDGNILPMTDAQVKAEQERLMKEGELIAAVMELNGEMSVQIFEPPSTRVCDTLERAAAAIRKALEGH